MLVADDEDNTLRLYRMRGGKPVRKFNMNRFLKTPKRREADIEGAARMGETVYWITSHGTNKEGKPRPGRHRLFATKVTVFGGKVKVSKVGTPYRGLVEAFEKDARLKRFGLSEAANKAPKSRGGLNIEGLARYGKDGLIIGLRNPTPDGKALLIPLENPGEVVGEGKEPRFGEPVLLPLGGRGIRSVINARDSYLIVAGARNGAPDFAFYKWEGGSDIPQPVPGPKIGGLNPEAMAFFPRRGLIALLSDDGALCKNRYGDRFRGTFLRY